MSESSKSDDLILGYFSVVGLSALLTCIFVAISTALLACFFDLRSQRSGIDDHPALSERAARRRKKAELPAGDVLPPSLPASEAPKSTAREGDIEKGSAAAAEPGHSEPASDNVHAPLLSAKEKKLEVEGLAPPSSNRMSSSRRGIPIIDANEKHRRVVEAVYIVSGRAVPPKYQSKSNEQSQIGRSVGSTLDETQQENDSAFSARQRQRLHVVGSASAVSAKKLERIPEETSAIGTEAPTQAESSRITPLTGSKQLSSISIPKPTPSTSASAPVVEGSKIQPSASLPKTSARETESMQKKSEK